MFRSREEHLVSGAARRLKRGVDQGMEPAEVFSRVQDHVIAIGHAHVERLVLDAFVDKVQSLPDSDNKVALGLLLDLFALTTIEENRAGFMEHGRLTRPRSDRKSGVSGKSVSVRVDLGGSLIIQKKKTTN